jgi:hypothetical protein
MDGTGALSNPLKLGSTLLTLGPLNHFESQSLEGEKIKSISRVGDLWIPLDITILKCCAQFYMLEIDDRIKTGVAS